jgi:hypothetical protein
MGTVRAPSVADGIPTAIEDDRRSTPLVRYARGSTPPPTTSRLSYDTLGELKTRRLLTPLTVIDDRWDLEDTEEHML